ncbi:MAG: hypothetical protein HGA69_00260 [Desulfobulbaceae bacterium]|nr:hypothetical protein [Desulfobulbaceae bacterium]
MVTYLVLGCVLYVYLDATKNKIGKVPEVKRFTNMSAGMWATGTAMLWIVVFPLYLLNRKKLIDIAEEKPQVVPSFRRYTITGLLAATCILLLWTEYA